MIIIIKVETDKMAKYLSDFSKYYDRNKTLQIVPSRSFKRWLSNLKSDSIDIFDLFKDLFKDFYDFALELIFLPILLLLGILRFLYDLIFIFTIVYNNPHVRSGEEDPTGDIKNLD